MYYVHVFHEKRRYKLGMESYSIVAVERVANCSNDVQSYPVYLEMKRDNYVVIAR
jgi:hypothetical protein